MTQWHGKKFVSLVSYESWNYVSYKLCSSLICSHLFVRTLTCDWLTDLLAACLGDWAACAAERCGLALPGLVRAVAGCLAAGQRGVVNLFNCNASLSK